MCRAVTCRTCGRPGWAGCGAHVERVLAHVPVDERCRCREERGDAAGESRLGKTLRALFGR